MPANSPTDAELESIARECADTRHWSRHAPGIVPLNQVILAALKDVRDRSQPAPLSADEPSDGAMLLAIIEHGWLVEQRGQNGHGHSWYCGRPHYCVRGTGTTAYAAIRAAMQRALPAPPKEGKTGA